jgi:acetylornithine deacetylase
VHLEIETIGRAAHGSRPDLGIDAIAKMGHILVGIEELDRRLRANPTHRYLGSGSVHASLVEGGQEYSSYPARCVVQAERRTIPAESVELAVGEIREILDGASASDSDFDGTVRALASREPFEVEESAEVVASVRRCAAAVMSAEPEVVGVSFWADSALLAGAGIPTVVFGPHGEGLHSEVEWVDVGSLEQCVEIYAAVAADICR